MAEVPEVEMLARGLREAVVGRRWTGAEVLVPEAVRFPAAPELGSRLAGRQVLSATRRAKHLLMPLDDGQTLAVHLMLWGDLKLRPAGAERKPATLVVFGLEGDEELHFTDTLGYARTALARHAELAQRLKLDELGPEVLDPSWGPEVLAQRLARRRSPLKTLLLDQNVVAGMGNRDADESLWEAGIDPRRTAASLSGEEVVRLARTMRQVLEDGLALGGTQKDLYGTKGRALHQRNVFERHGQACPRCGEEVQRVRLGGRNTHYCARCQPAAGASPPAPAPAQSDWLF
ncbi:bifunctional DNA-formamidopyrimidine glycosylase/DNA-(apurinic or apyrimidinic site) lyase [Aggregicoccus sp. 17bor-14]|uniref:bifunctional DNA-formamidopyrimidine glycosylase/DNA-(apurinic or apyrimidinic site) lyase n=1 Tax=Myxococcaceae TaxID=31 RepID=UPI00129C2B28|nr:MULTISPECIES: bifunctional DNA-formamidopyrimidine glycosylase/DNA-(apurinic or apyrimidinic site) lyase [Myxococcaceae]MBF5043850.1 bifunctional DNA-formamidopyrimidine glycosylase/DNA-(apurinic or apyrimidinic site) lyase [Simulacricoccus sp. 17bor-14]MRI89602.1 bifunctional DNA-formamidopyrimidine glycosylase/DNA-(apurinic or apyrimidinic site) lyase [Aggregicoccus sp. 17bor-14]